MTARDDRDEPSLVLPSLRGWRRRHSSTAEPEPRPEPPLLFVDEVGPAPWRRTPPRPSGRVAAMLTGALVGLLAVGLAWLLLRLCGLVTGTSSCGNPGLLLLIVVVVVLGSVGAVMLRALGVGSPGSTSALGMGLLTVGALLFLGDALFSRWMTLALPLLSLAAYTLAHLVITAATPDS